MKNSSYEYINDDYVQSANTLFHFMKELAYLQQILLKKAIVPRYCKEDVKYLDIRNEEVEFKEIYVLQKCFCDIPFNKLTKEFRLDLLPDMNMEFSEAELKELSDKNTHLDFYGEYAIAFSKKWGEENNLQKDGKFKVIYGSEDINPMYISYKGFVSEEQAQKELDVIMEKQEDYMNAMTLNENLQGVYK